MLQLQRQQWSFPARPKTMSRINSLTDLSTDCLTIVFSFLVARSDIVSVCLTSKTLYDICISTLYRTVALNLGRDKDRSLIPFLNSRNKGLPYIRTLDFGLASDSGDEGELRQSQFVLGLMLESLAPNTLEEFIWRSWDPLAAENLKRLYSTQKRLKYLECGAVTPAVDHKMMKELNIISVMEHVEDLGLYIDSKGALEHSSELLKNMRRDINKIVINNKLHGDDPIPEIEWQDSSMGPGSFATTMFRHMLPLQKCKPVKIRDVILQCVYLRYPRDSFCRVIDFSNVRRLWLQKCKGAEVLLSELCRSSLLPTQLEALHFIHTEDNNDSEATKALEGFLSLISGLREIFIDIKNASALPSMSKIIHHSTTLRAISIHAYEDHDCSLEHVYPSADFTRLCQSSPNLTQLSVAFPEQEIISRGNDDYNAYKDALLGPDTYLPQLTVLQITTWPTENAISTRTPRGLYDALLQVKAMEFLCARDHPIEPSPAPSSTSTALVTMTNTASTGIPTSQRVTPHRPLARLQLVEYGSEGCLNTSCNKNGTTATIFVRSTVATPDGRSATTAVSVVPSWREQNLDLPAEILDVELARHKSPPTSARGREDAESGFVPLGWKLEKEDQGHGRGGGSIVDV